MSSVSTKAGAALAAEVARRRKVVEIPSTGPAPSSANVHVVTADATSHEPSLDERTRIFARGLKLPVPNRPDQHIDLAFLDPLVFLREPFTAALSDYLQDRPASTREGFVGSVRTGICAFLVGAKPDASMSTLSSDLIRAYIDWQHSPLASETGQAVLQPGTNASRTKAARFLFGVLRKSTRWGADAAAIHSFFPTNLGKGVSGTATPRQTLTQDLLNEIYAAAKREIDTLGSRFKEGDDLLRQGDELVEAGKDTPELPVIYSRMVSAYPNAFPVRETICSDRQLRRDLQHLQYLGYGGIVTLARYRYASAIDLVPIVLLLAIEGAFNADSVLAIQTTDIVRVSVLGTSVLRITAPKGRAAGGVYVKDLEPEIVDPWLALIERATTHIRADVAQHNRNTLFIFGTVNSKDLVKAYELKTRITSGSFAWEYSLRQFRERNSLPHFTLAQLRPTLIDMVGQRYGALAASKVARHRTLSTTEASYTGSGTRDREREELAVAVAHYERWVTSGGRIDVREDARPGSSDKGAATPGFTCLDPYQSPIAGQVRNRLCRAYGECPLCPLSTANFEDPLSVAYWTALLVAIDVSRSDVPPQQWLTRWGPVTARLIVMLDHVDEAVSARSGLLSITLPRVA